GRPGQPARRHRGGGAHAGGGGRDLRARHAHVGHLHVLRGPRPGAAHPAPGPVRPDGPAGHVTRAWPRAAVVVVPAVAALGLPLSAADPAWVNIGVFTLMYVGLATAWNIMGGYTGYISLGHAGFFGAGAYSLGLIVNHLGVPGGIGPFLLLPAAGLVTAVVAV